MKQPTSISSGLHSATHLNHTSPKMHKTFFPKKNIIKPQSNYKANSAKTNLTTSKTASQDASISAINGSNEISSEVEKKIPTNLKILSSTRLIVKQLPKFVQDKQLKEHIEAAGFILSDCRILKTPNGKSRRFAFLGFPTFDEAQKALDYFHKTYFHTSQILVEKAHAPGSVQLNRPWSKYSKGSSGYDLRAKKAESNNSDTSHEKGYSGSSEQAIFNKKRKSNDLEEATTTFDPFDSKRKLIKIKPTKAGMASIRFHTTFDDDENNATTTNENQSENLGLSTPQSTDLNLANSSLDDLEWLKSISGTIEDEFSTSHQPISSDLTHKIQKGTSPDSTSQKDIEKDNTVKAKNDVKESQIQNDIASSLPELIQTENISSDLTTTPDSNSTPKEILADKKETISTEHVAEVALDGRIMLLNIPYNCTEDEVRQLCSKYGEISDISLPTEEDTGRLRGFAFVSFVFPDHANEALKDLKNQIFMGRLLIVKVASLKPSTDVNPVTSLSSFKAKKQEALKKAAEDPKTWNLLYLSANSTVNTISEHLGVDKSELLDLESDRIAVNVALGETHLINQTKQWLKNEGLNLEAFERNQTNWLNIGNPSQVPRSSEAIIIKHLPGESIVEAELREMFASVGTLIRFSISPSRLVAIARYVDAPSAKRAFTKFSFKRFHSIPLYLEWAPDDLFTDDTLPTSNSQISTNNFKTVDKLSSDLNSTAFATFDPDDNSPSVSLYVKNLSFETSDHSFISLFEGCDGFRKAKIMRKKKAVSDNPAKEDSSNDSSLNLSMGYGFVEFDSLENATTALEKLNNYILDEHKLDISISQRNVNPNSKPKGPLKAPRGHTKIFNAYKNGAQAPQNITEKQKGVTKKLIIKNMPFEASRKELNLLFSTYGNVTAVRLPKKSDGTNRGYAFVEFLTATEASHAIQALQHTHFYGRHLVIQPSFDESGDALFKQATEKAKLVQKRYQSINSRANNKKKPISFSED